MSAPRKNLPAGALGGVDVEVAFRKATLVDYGLLGLFESPNEPLSERTRQEIFALWEVAHDVQNVLAKAHCPEAAEDTPAAAGGAR